MDQRKTGHTYSHVAQVSDTAQVTRKVSLLGLNGVRTRQEISKHISIAYNMIYHLMTSYIKGAALGSNDLLPGGKSKRPGIHAKVMGINQLN